MISVLCLGHDKGLHLSLSDLSGFAISFGSPDEIRMLVSRLRPDVVVFDIRENKEGLAQVEALRRWQPRVRILLIVDDKEDDQVLLRYLFAGVMGYVTQSHLPMRMGAAILAVNQGQAWVPRQAVTHFIDAMAALDQECVLR